jgi:hypothetical protein
MKMETGITKVSVDYLFGDEESEKGVFYSDEDYCYYDCETYMMQSAFHSIVRFKRQEMPKVLMFFATKPPYELYDFLKSLDGYETMLKEQL